MDKKIKAALLSIISNSTLVILKLVVGFLTNSVSILSEAIHSGLDLLASFIAFWAVRISSKPADKNHQYGHGKFENVSALVEAFLIFIAAFWIIHEAIKKLYSDTSIENTELGIVVMIFSAGLNWFVSSFLNKVAEQENSIALEADALHLRTDVYTSVGVLIALILIHFTGFVFIDSFMAILVALLILKEAWNLSIKAFLPLVDTGFNEEEEKKVIEVLKSYTNEFIEFHNLRTRKSGAEYHIDLHLVVPKDWSVEKVHNLCNEIEDSINKAFEKSDCLIHVEPCDKSCKAIKTCEPDNCPYLGNIKDSRNS